MLADACNTENEEKLVIDLLDLLISQRRYSLRC